MRKSKHLFVCEVLIVSGLVCLGFISANLARASQERSGLTALEISGTVRSQLFSMGSGSPKEFPQASFRFISHGLKWLLHLEYESTALYDYQQLGYNGTNLFFLSSFEERNRRREADGVRTGENRATAWIYADSPIPHAPFAHEAGPIWLTYGSPAYLDSRNHDQLEPVISYGSSGIVDHRNVRAQRFQALRDPSPPGYLQRLVYFDDGMIPVFDERHEPSLIRRPPPYDRGFTNAIFEVIAVTNYNRLRLPSLARIEYYAPDADGTTPGDIRVRGRYMIEVTGVRAGVVTPESFRPDIMGKTAVTDARFRGEAGELVFLVDKDWPSEEQVRRSESFGRAKAMRSSSFWDGGRRKVASVMFVFLAASLGFALMKSSRSNTTNRKENT